MKDNELIGYVGENNLKVYMLTKLKINTNIAF